MFKKNIINYIYIITGCLIVAMSINIFLIPNKITTGGANGVATVIYYLFKIPVSLTILLLNLPLFIIALKNIGLKFCSKAIVGTVFLAVFIWLTDILRTVSWLSFSEDLFLTSIFGGITMGVGMSIVFKGEGSTGGSDLLAQIIYKKRNASSLGQIILLIDTVVITILVIAFKDINYGLYSVVSLYLSKKTIDIMFEGIGSTKVITIITRKGEEIAKEIIQKTDRGVTINANVIGKYTDRKYDQVISIVNTSDLSKIKKIIKKIDKTSFVYISNTSEVLGLGFKEI